MTGADEPLKLDELAQRAGVAPRTVRYYVQRGLLPAPIFRGKDTAYGRGHLARLQAIKRLQAQFLPLDAIQAALACRTDDEIEALARSPVPCEAPPAPEGGASGGEGQAGGCGPEPNVYGRWQLAPGLELHLEAGASDEAKALAEQILRLSARSKGAGE